MQIIQNFKLIVILLFLPLVGMASEIDNLEVNLQDHIDKIYNDTYSVESRIVSSKEITGEFGEKCTVHRVEHVVYRTDGNGQKWFFARGVVDVSDCHKTDDEIPDTVLPIEDQDCKSVFVEQRLISNYPISEEIGSCFVDFATQNESNHQMLIDSEQRLLKG